MIFFEKSYRQSFDAMDDGGRSLIVQPPPTPTSDFAPRISDPSEAIKTLWITCGRPETDTVIPRMASLEVEGRDGQQADLDEVARGTRW